MEKKKVEFEINPTKVMGWIATILGITTAGYAMASWIDDASESHEKTEVHAEQLDVYPPPEIAEDVDKLTIIVEQLNKQQEFERKLWGPAYEKKIMEILDKEQKQAEEGEATGSE